MALISTQQKHFVHSIVSAIERFHSSQALLAIGRMIVTSRVLEISEDHDAIFWAFANRVEEQGLQGADLGVFARVIPDMLEQYERMLGKGDFLYPHTDR